MHYLKVTSKALVAAVAVMVASTTMATQTVNPFTAATGGTNLNGTTVPFSSNQVVFYGRYSASQAESGLGLKVKYDSSKVTLAVAPDTDPVVADREYQGCRIAPAQVQVNGANSQVVMGWIDTSIRTGGAVGWPNVAEPTVSPQAPCLDPGNINGTPTGSFSDLSLFKITATRVAGFTSGTTTISLESDGNFSYASGTPGFTNKSFTIDAAAVGGFSLAASNPYVSRKNHNGTDFDIVLNGSALITGPASASGATIESRQATAGSNPNPHRVVFRFSNAVQSAGTVTAQTQSSASVTATTTVSGNDVIVTLGSVPDRSRVQISLSGVTSSAASGTLNPSVVVGFLAGDVDGNGTVQPGDVLFAQQRLNLPAVVTGNRFKADIDNNGTIQPGDVLAIQQRLNRTLQ